MTLKNHKQATILLVDDEPSALKPLIAFLREQELRVVGAQSGEAALKLVSHHPPDLILLDILMPGMDGFETCRRLKEHKTLKEIPVIFLTGRSDTVNKVNGFELGGVDYITKPVQYEEVLARVNAHLTNRQLQQQLQAEHARFQTLAEATFEGVLIHDDRVILDGNQAAVQMFGFPIDDLKNKNILELFATEERTVVEEKLRLQDEEPCESQGLRKNDTVFPLETQIKTVPYHGYTVRVMAVRDITWRKRMEKEKASLQRENFTLRSTLKDRCRFREIIGRSQVMQEVYEAIVKAAASQASVIIYGESGTGKELVARTIHQESDRSKHNFVAVNCGAVPEALFEREFFGHRKGAFTGASTDTPGYFDRANKGTLFLDEVSQLSLPMQVKLLRVLQDGEYMPLGGTRTRKADVRIIAATNKDLRVQLRDNTMREDFFYRIRVLVIELPPLRGRKEDLPLLIDHFVKLYATNHDEPIMLPRATMKALCDYDWPGNIRELQNELQRYLGEHRLEFIGNDFPESIERGGKSSTTLPLPEGSSFREAVEAYEKRLIANALQQVDGHLGKASQLLHIPLKTLYRKVEKYHLKIPSQD